MDLHTVKEEHLCSHMMHILYTELLNIFVDHYLNFNHLKQ